MTDKKQHSPSNEVRAQEQAYLEATQPVDAPCGPRGYGPPINTASHASYGGPVVRHKRLDELDHDTDFQNDGVKESQLGLVKTRKSRAEGDPDHSIMSFAGWGKR